MFLVEPSDKKVFPAPADLLSCSCEDSGCSAAPYQQTVNVRRHPHLLTLLDFSLLSDRKKGFKSLP